MKIINRSSSTKKIQWSKKDISIDNVTETVLRFKKLVLNQGTSAFDQINKELNSKSPKSFKVKKSEILKSDSLVSDKLKQSILNSAANIKTICENDKKGFIGTPVETTKGIKIWKEFRPIDSVGIYVPGGSAPLISSLLIQLIPASVAGCKNIIICTPPNKNGLVGREEATGRGVQYIVREFFRNDELLKLIKFTPTMEDKTFIVQGLGNVGYHAAKFISQDDKIKLIGIAEHNGGIFNLEGINVDHAKKYFLNQGSFKDYPKATFIKDASLLLKKQCDILIPAARENVITEKNANDIKAKLIVEAANGPITYKAHTILNRKKVFVIPDILANSGGVAVSYFEWVKNIRRIRFGRLEKRKNIIQMNNLIEAIESMTGTSMPAKYKNNFLEGTNEIDLIRSGLDDMMIDGFQEVKKEFLGNEKIPDFRTAAYKVAIEKIAMSYDSIGL